ncbi:f-actin-capping protein subunit beta-like [Plasmopara halstedii]|uniref:F-actin-capping protein subunit beta n=1 Tax=Plasmopara halstedii TaxID=4781 RepID=A0A0P1ANP8_PLAHL|nr:f-actin-capping protein subunit beta-like [Plasmopara halstedii]CEG43124.1 f-actin-capping protein subunit beta-like [Plasmopara halstedii]|eukprot:XP_024579493.1 f-actin-capping protein subunit beta-like [Plasmopara halstedii]
MSTDTKPDGDMTSCLNLMRRMPPREVETNTYHLTRIVPSLADDLYQRVDQPLQVGVDPANGRKYLLCDYNRDGESYRSPWTNQYHPPLSDTESFYPSKTLRGLEIQANEIFDSYRELYYQGGISSVYMWDLEPGFAACFLIKKDVEDQRFVQKGEWNSIHVIEVQECSDVLDKGVKKATYRLTTSVLLFMKVKNLELGHLTLDGALTRQAERVVEFQDQFAHVSNMGRMVEDMEIDMRSSLDGLYISKTREVINGMRKLQQGPAMANPFVNELTGAVLNHGQKKQQE